MTLEISPPGLHSATLMKQVLKNSGLGSLGSIRNVRWGDEKWWRFPSGSKSPSGAVRIVYIRIFSEQGPKRQAS